MVFFVLSGFLISSSVFRKLHQGAWSWRDYAIDRSVRLYAVLIPGLVLGYTWDSLGVKAFNSSGIYSAPLPPFGTTVPINDLSLKAFIGNLLFLQNRFAPVFGSNGPLWSLFNEFWYYVLFPAIVFALLYALKSRMASAFACTLIAIFACWILQGQLEGFVIWLFGCGVSLFVRYASFKARARWLLAPFICCSGIALAFSLRPEGADLWVGVSFAFLLYGVLQLHRPVGRFFMNSFRSFAEFSYSLYVLHFPLMFLVRAAFFPSIRWQPDGRHMFYAGCISTCVLGYAFAIAQVTEANTPKIRLWVRRNFNGNQRDLKMKSSQVGAAVETEGGLSIGR
jgi:peptidoglycan/LPS O-acetylase OafA/YrhL